MTQNFASVGQTEGIWFGKKKEMQWRHLITFPIVISFIPHQSSSVLNPYTIYNFFLEQTSLPFFISVQIEDLFAGQ